MRSSEISATGATDERCGSRRRSGQSATASPREDPATAPLPRRPAERQRVRGDHQPKRRRRPLELRSPAVPDPRPSRRTRTGGSPPPACPSRAPGRRSARRSLATMMTVYRRRASRLQEDGSRFASPWARRRASPSPIGTHQLPLSPNAIVPCGSWQPLAADEAQASIGADRFARRSCFCRHPAAHRQSPVRRRGALASRAPAHRPGHRVLPAAGR
jgi:hypothetical protein